MPTSVVHWNFPADGEANIQDIPGWLAVAVELGESMAAEFKSWYLPLGQYDIVTVADYSDGETATKHIMQSRA